MARSNNIFTRIEKKYVLTEKQHSAIMPIMWEHMKLDMFGRSTVSSLYYDTPDNRIIRSSIEKPVYKEKLRLRCYHTPDDHGEAFVELKKKYKGIVYKRRIQMEHASAVAFLDGTGPVPSGKDAQIGREIAYFLQFYKGIRPAYAVFCDRLALVDKIDENLRLTIDANIRYRIEDLDLRHGSYGKTLLPSGNYVMEVKTASAMPLWMTHLLNENEVYPSSFSKYGTAYAKELRRKLESGHNSVNIQLSDDWRKNNAI